jgi:hypothetical protein
VTPKSDYYEADTAVFRVKNVKIEKLGLKAKGGKIIKACDVGVFILREPPASYSAIFNSKKEKLGPKNSYFFVLNPYFTIV